MYIMHPLKEDYGIVCIMRFVNKRATATSRHPLWTGKNITTETVCTETEAQLVY